MASEAYRAIIRAAEDYLRSTHSVGPGAAKSNKQIVQALRASIKAGDLKVDVTDGTMLS
jgi:hypothetical protein